MYKEWNRSYLQENDIMHQSADKISHPHSDIFSSLIESLPLHVYAKDSEGRFIHANNTYCKEIGVPLEKLIGLNDFDVHPKELAEKYRRDDSRIMEHGQTESLEEKWESTLGDGGGGWVQTIKAPLRDHNTHDIIGTVGVFWDITEKKVGEIALAEERSLLRTLIDNLPDYIYVKDIESRFIVANEAVARLMGVNIPDLLLGRTDSDFYPAYQAEKFHADEHAVVTTGQPVINTEENVTSFSGEKRRILTTKVPLKNVKGEITGIIGIGHDVTEQRETEIENKRLEKQLQHAQRMETIGTLTAGIAHDFNNLLSVINGYTELMKLTTPAEHNNQENLGRVLAAGRNAAKLVGQLLAFSRKQVAQARVISINSEIELARAMLQRILGNNIHLHFEPQDQLWPVRMDPAQLEQIVVNIATNARDAMPDGGELVIRTGNVMINTGSPSKHPSLGPGEWVELVMKDSGEGMTHDVQCHIFEPFFTTKPKQQGTGLGLATVFGIVKQNKGYIFVASAPGHGAEFTVYLPRSEGTVVEKTGTETATVDLPFQGHGVILIVEDDLAVQRLARTILTDNGYTVYTANNGAEALLVIEQKGSEISLVLTDVVMPGMSGKMLADEVARRNLDMKVLFISGYTDDIISKYGILESGVEFIQKPFQSDELVRKIRGLLAGEDKQGDHH